MRTLKELKEFELDDLKEFYQASKSEQERKNIEKLVRHRIICWGCGAKLKKRNTPRDYTRDELVVMELMDDGFYCVKCDKENYPFLYERDK